MSHLPRNTLWLVAVLSACASHPSSAPRQDSVPSRASELAALIERGDTVAAFDVVRSELERLGAPTPGNLRLETQPVTEPLSTFSYDDHVLRLTSLPKAGEGMAYWQNWSNLVTGGAWDPAKVFVDEADAQATGAYAVLGIAAHELGHAIAQHLDINPEATHAQELLADRIAVAAMLELDRIPALAALRERYREAVVGSLLDAIPGAATIPPGDLDAWVASTSADPSNLPGYVGLQLARQRRLFTEAEAQPASTPRASIALHALDPARTLIRVREATARWLWPSVTATQASLPESFAESDDEAAVIRGPSCPCVARKFARYDGDGNPMLVTLGSAGGTVSRLGSTGREDVAVWGAEVWSQAAFQDMTQIEFVAVTRLGELWVAGRVERTPDWVLKVLHVSFSAGSPVARLVHELPSSPFLEHQFALTESERPVVLSHRFGIGMNDDPYLVVSWLDPATGAITQARTFQLVNHPYPADEALVDRDGDRTADGEVLLLGVGQGGFYGEREIVAADDGTVVFFDRSRRGFRAVRDDHLWGVAGQRTAEADVLIRLFGSQPLRAGPAAITINAPRSPRLLANGDLVFTELVPSEGPLRVYATRTLRLGPRGDGR